MLSFDECGIHFVVQSSKIVNEGHIIDMVRDTIAILETDKSETIAFCTTGDTLIFARREAGTIEVYVTRIHMYGSKQEARGVAIL